MNQIGVALLVVVLIAASFAVDARVALAGASVLLLISWARSERAASRRRARQLHRSRCERAELRETRLELAGVPRTQMDELSALVALARRVGADGPDFDALLDRYADASITAHFCMLAALGSTDADDALQERITSLCDFRDEIADQIRFSTARALLPHPLPSTDDALMRRLALLDREGLS